MMNLRVWSLHMSNTRALQWPHVKILRATGHIFLDVALWGHLDGSKRVSSLYQTAGPYQLPHSTAYEQSDRQGLGPTLEFVGSGRGSLDSPHKTKGSVDATCAT